MLKTIFRRANLGFSIGILLGDGIAILSGSLLAGELVMVSEKMMSLTDNVVLAFIIQTLLSGLYGAITFSTTVFYDIERLSLIMATALHCLVVVGTFIPMALFLGWGTDDPIVFITMISCQILGFFIVWLIMYIKYKKQVKELNEMQSMLLKRKMPN